MAGRATWYMWDGAGTEGNREGKDPREPVLMHCHTLAWDSNSNLASLSF